jgi:hypothetical protein
MGHLVPIWQPSTDGQATSTDVSAACTWDPSDAWHWVSPRDRGNVQAAGNGPYPKERVLGLGFRVQAMDLPQKEGFGV